jgi:hypothetical protein
MKKSLLVIAALSFLVSYPLESQGVFSKVKIAVAKDILGTNKEDSNNNSSKPGPEPKCACDNAKLIMDLTRYKIDYKEMSVSMKDDGSLLVRDKLTGKYFVVKDGVSQGPYNENDSQVTEFDSVNKEANNDKGKEAWAVYPGFITKSGEKFTIKFNGKNYGPYAIINDFAVAKSKDKFAAIVTENLAVTEDQGKKLEEAMKNAKTDQERMDIAMKLSQQMQNQMVQGGGVSSMQPKLISNVPGAIYDPVTWMGGRLNGSVKFDELLVIAPDRILDMTGKTVMKLTQNSYSTEGLFVNASNTKYASYNYGALTFSDNTTLAEVFNPYLIKTTGTVYLTYMYYSPGKNSIMQCSIPF